VLAVVLAVERGGLDGVGNGACWETFMFVMFRVNGAELPTYVHRTLVWPHVNISATGWKAKDGEVLAAAELLVDTEVATVEGVEEAMMRRSA
jgi:hypothetical protein